MGVCFGNGVVEEPVKTGFEGLADVTVDDGASNTECASEFGDITVAEVGFVCELIDNVEVAFGVGKEFGVFRMSCEVGVFGVDEGFKLSFAGDECVLDGGLPDVDGYGLIGGRICHL